MYDIYEMKDNRWTVTDIIELLDDAYEEFGPGQRPNDYSRCIQHTR